MPVAVSVTLCWAQVSVPLSGVTVRNGATVLLKTVVLAEVVQPLDPVMVTEYRPDTLTGRVLPLPTNVPDGPAKA